MTLYDSIIHNSIEDKKSIILKNEINDLIYLFNFLNKQISKSYKTEIKLERLNNKLEKKLVKHNNDTHRFSHSYIHKRFSRIERSLDRYSIYFDLKHLKDDRNFLNYYREEIEKLRMVKIKIRKNVSMNDYETFLEEIYELKEFRIIFRYLNNEMIR